MRHIGRGCRARERAAHVGRGTSVLLRSLLKQRDHRDGRASGVRNCCDGIWQVTLIERIEHCLGICGGRIADDGDLLGRAQREVERVERFAERCRAATERGCDDLDRGAGAFTVGRIAGQGCQLQQRIGRDTVARRYCLVEQILRARYQPLVLVAGLEKAARVTIPEVV